MKNKWILQVFIISFILSAVFSGISSFISDFNIILRTAFFLFIFYYTLINKKKKVKPITSFAYDLHLKVF